MKLQALSTLFTVFLLGGCAIHADMPESFLKLSNDRYELKATSADDAIFWVRRFDTEPEDSSLDFWEEALTNNLVKGRGYHLVERDQIETRGGLPGRVLVVEANVGGQTRRELFAVFLKERLWGGPIVYVAEYVAPPPLFEQYLEKVREAIESLNL